MYLLQADTIMEAGKTLSLFSGLDLFIVAFLIIAVILIWKLLPKWIDKKSEIRMYEINSKNLQMEYETNALVKETSKRLEKLETVLQDFNKNGSKEIEKNVLKSIIYNENVPVLERLECFNKYLKLGGNGNCRKFAMKIIIENRKLWDSILNNEEVIIDNLNRYYKDSIKEIKVRLM